jgi:cytoskeletal protein CcmA (bactofilin family)
MFTKKTTPATLSVTATTETRAASSSSGPKVPSIISAGMTIRGDMIGAGDLQIEGTVVGRVDVDHLVIAANGTVEGDVVAKAVRVLGVVDGSVSAETVSLAASSKVKGTVEYESLVIEAGARLEGQCRRLAMGTREENKIVSEPTVSAVETSLSHLSSVPRRVA